MLVAYGFPRFCEGGVGERVEIGLGKFPDIREWGRGVRDCHRGIHGVVME